MDTPKRLLIIDPNVCVASPSMKAVVASIPYLRSQGWEVEVWCWDLEEGLEVDKVVYLNKLGRVHTLSFYVFSCWCALEWQKVLREGRSFDLVYSVAWYHSPCDVLHVHFSPFDWERRQRDLGIKSLRDLYERFSNAISLFRAKMLLRNTTAQLVLSVSKSVRDDLQCEAPHLRYGILENCYNPKVFHLGLREEVRSQKRKELGYQTEDKVFIFASAGHYRRKGFALAFKAIQSLRERFPQAKFLVVGGSGSRLADLKKWCDREDAQWSKWLQFTGMVKDIEKYFAAADAFLFPSYSEAFALVEIEAAATGLPLFLTPHHGSEMILEEGVNGRSIPFDVAGIQKVLEEFLSGSWVPSLEEAKMLHAIDREEYAKRLDGALNEALTMKRRALGESV